MAFRTRKVYQTFKKQAPGPSLSNTEVYGMASVEDSEHALNASESDDDSACVSDLGLS